MRKNVYARVSGTFVEGRVFAKVRSNKKGFNKDAIVRADRLLSRSGEWGRGIDQKRQKALATAIKEDCLRGIFSNLNTPKLLAHYLCWIEKEEKSYREWLTVKKLLRKRRIRARAAAKLNTSSQEELEGINRRLEWMRLSARSPAEGNRSGTKPFLHGRWEALARMERLLISDYRDAVRDGLAARSYNLAIGRAASEAEAKKAGRDLAYLLKRPIPAWATITNLQRIGEKNMGRKTRAATLACIMALSHLPK